MKNIFLYSLSFILFLTACKKENFDAPPAEDSNPDIVANTLIADLKDLYKGTPLRIEEDLIVEGVVVADDRSGNFYKSIVIQDQTAGILLLLDGIGLYNNYPIGRKVFVNCKDLFIGEYNGLIQLGGGADNGSLTRIMEALIPSHLIKGPLNVPVTPIKLTLTDVLTPYQNMLVSFSKVEFEAPGQSYADADNLRSKNLLIADCQGASLIVRSSGYASFAAQIVPDKNGDIVGVLGVFRSDFQLLIRDTIDVKMTNDRCNGGGSSQTVIPIFDARELYEGATINAIADKISIKGIVITDRSNGNETGRNLVIQDETAGIVVRFAANHSFDLNTELEISIEGVELSLFNGLLQLNNVPLANAKIIGSKMPVPLIVEVSDVLDNIKDLESRLIQIKNATITGGATYSGSRTLRDASGSLTLFTSSAASFKDASIPSGNVTVTGVVSVFNTPQLKLRSLNDIL